MSAREFFNSRIGFFVSVVGFGVATYYGLLAGIPA